jgi:hypothetical protein
VGTIQRTPWYDPGMARRFGWLMHAGTLGQLGLPLVLLIWWVDAVTYLKSRVYPYHRTRSILARVHPHALFISPTSSSDAFPLGATGSVNDTEQRQWIVPFGSYNQSNPVGRRQCRLVCQESGRLRNRPNLSGVTSGECKLLGHHSPLSGPGWIELSVRRFFFFSIRATNKPSTCALGSMVPAGVQPNKPRCS